MEWKRKRNRRRNPLLREAFKMMKAFREEMPHCLFITNRTALLQNLPQNSVCAEIGVFNGSFSKEILNISKPSKLHLIDCWEHQDQNIYHCGHNKTNKEFEKVYKQVCQTFSQYKQVQIHKEMSINAAKNFNNEYFDWIYVDGNHSYECVKADLLAYEPKVKAGGTICGHDYANHSLAIDHHYGVIRAVNEFCEERGWNIVSLTDQPFPSYTLKKYKDIP